MSLTRPIWNDGQGLATPDLQRPCDLVGAADDRLYEVLVTPGAVAKKILPLSEESATLNPRLLAIPSAAGLTPAGVNGAVRFMPCELIAGAPTSTQQVALAVTTYAPLDTLAITSNSSGSIRYDLIYATVNRAVSVTGTRKIKSATDGSLSSQSINLSDAPAVTLGINVGFLTGATAPTIAQINAALPADTAPSSSTFGSFNFAIGYVTVANGYTTGTALFQDSSGGSTFINQCWSGGFVPSTRARGARPMSFYTGAANERPGGSLQNTVAGAERWRTVRQYFAHFKVLATSSNSYGGALVLDNSIDWRNRFVWGFWTYIGSATLLPLDNSAPAMGVMLSAETLAGANPQPVYNTGVFSPVWTGSGQAITDAFPMRYTDGATFVTNNITCFTDGTLRMRRGSGPIDAANGDAFAVIFFATDQLRISG